MIEAEEVKEGEQSKIENLEQLRSLGIEKAFSLIRERFEESGNPEKNLPFHNSEHTAGVTRRAEALAQAMGLSEDEIRLVGLTAAWHDVIQKYGKSEPDGKVMRDRSLKKILTLDIPEEQKITNEESSANELMNWINEVKADKLVEGREDSIREAIMATVPGWDQENKTVSQPNLKPDSGKMARCLAMSDLGVAGMEGVNFTKEGDPLFREENLDIAEAIGNAKTHSDISQEKQVAFKARMLAWTKIQPGFAKGRQARLEQELGNLDDESKEKVRALFSHFNEAIQAAEQLAKEREDKDFWEIAEAMGYKVPEK